MKKRAILILLPVFLVIMLFTGNNAYAQDESLKINSPGALSAEMNFIPFSNQPLSINQLQFRYFTDQTSAYRLGVDLGYQSFRDDPSPDIEISGGVLDIAIIPGIEFHASGTNRFSPYYGVEAELRMRRVSATERERVGDTVTEIEYSGFYEDEQGSVDFGLRGLVGFDLYIQRNLYIGAEFGWGLDYSKDADSVVRVGAQTNEVEGTSMFSVGSTFNPAFRIGWAFL